MWFISSFGYLQSRVHFICRIYTITDLSDEGRFLKPFITTLGWLVRSRFQDTLSFENVTAQSGEVANFKDTLKEAYNQPMAYDKGLLDMATGAVLPHNIVIAAHIFQCRWQKYLSSFSTMTGVDDACNGLLLYKPVEWAFDRAKLFVEIIDGVMTFHLIDQELENIKLVDKAIELQAQNRCPGTCSQEEAVLKITFSDLDGAVLSFPPNCKMQPSKRMLLIDAYSSWIHVNGTTGRHSPPIYNKSGYDLSGDKDVKNVLDTTVMMWRQALDNQQTLDNE